MSMLGLITCYPSSQLCQKRDFFKKKVKWKKFALQSSIVFIYSVFLYKQDAMPTEFFKKLICNSDT